MGHWIENFQGPPPSYYKRYVDNIFSVFNNSFEAKEFFNYINTRHPNINFTMETEVNKIIPFLAALIDYSQNILKTSTYHKFTYSRLLLNDTSFTSRFYKTGLIKCLIDRAYKIDNTWPSFHDDVPKIKIKKFYSEVNKLRYFKLPYIGKYSEQVQKKITKLCKQYCNENNVKIVTLFRISH